VAFTFRGIGTMQYGERDFRADGSYVVTEWFVVAYLPLFPLCSKRILPTGASTYHGLRRIPTVGLLERTSPNVQQVICVYAWFAFTLGIIWAEVVWNKGWLFLPGVAIALLLPWYLRRRARQSVRDTATRKAAGMSAETID